MTTVEHCEDFRREIKPIAKRLGDLRHAIPVGVMNPDEFFANITLAYRALEDASMRLGKAIQAADGGASIYDPAQVPKSADHSAAEETAAEETAEE